MDFLVDVYVLRPNSSVKDMNCWIAYTGDLFIVVMVCVEPATLLGLADNRR